MWPRYFWTKYRALGQLKKQSSRDLDPDGNAALAMIAARFAALCAADVRGSLFHDTVLHKDAGRILLPKAAPVRQYGDKIASFHAPKRFLTPPQHLTERPSCFFDGRLYAAAQNLLVYTLAGGYVGRIGDAPVIWANDGRTIIPSCSSRFAPMLALSGCDIKGILARAPMIAGTVLVLMGDYQSENYCHWLLDEMPRLGLVPVSSDLRIAMRPLKHAFQFEILRRWGISPEQFIMMEDFSALRADRLIVFDHVPHNTAPAHHAAEWMCRPIRQHLAPVRTDKADKIYVARDDARGRRIVNASAFEAVLAAHGYQKFVPGMMSCQDQIDLFAGARRIIAPHGAALANLVFCQKLEQLIEIFPPDYGTPFAHVLADAVGARYMTFCTRDKIAGQRPQQDDIHIDVTAWQAATDGVL